MNNLFIKLQREQLRKMKALPKAAILVWLELQFYMIGDKIECWPSQARLADDLGMAARTVRTAIAELKGRGLIVVDADKRSTNSYKNGKGEPIEDQKIQEENLIRFPLPTGSNDPIHEDQTILSTGSNDPIHEDQTILLNREKKEKKEIEKRKESKVAKLAESFEVDKRDLWIEALVGQHATALGWTTSDLIADIKEIKEGFNILEVERGCKSLDVFIRENKKHNLFRGRAWVQGLHRWIKREPSGNLTESQAKKYARSIIVIDAHAADREQKQAFESALAAQNAAMIGAGGAKGIWADIFAKYDGDMLSISNHVANMVKNNEISKAMQEEIAQDEDLEIFDALIGSYIFKARGYNV